MASADFLTNADVRALVTRSRIPSPQTPRSPLSARPLSLSLLPVIRLQVPFSQVSLLSPSLLIDDRLFNLTFRVLYTERLTLSYINADGRILGDSNSTGQKLSDSTRSGADDASDSSKGYLQSAQEGLSNAAGSVSNALGGKLLFPSSVHLSAFLLTLLSTEQTWLIRYPTLQATNPEQTVL